MTKRLMYGAVMAGFFGAGMMSCHEKKATTESETREMIECNTQKKEEALSDFSLKELKKMIKMEPSSVASTMEGKCFQGSELGKLLFIQDMDKVDSLKIKYKDQNDFFLNKVTSLQISQEIVYKLIYTFPIKYLNQYKVEIQKETKKKRYSHTSTMASSDEYQVTYNIERFDAKKLRNTYSYQIDTYDGFAKLTIYYSEDLPVD